MKRIFFSVLIICFMQIVASAQNMQTVIKTEALKMAKALSALDLEKYALFSWPALVNDANSKQMIKQGVDSAAKFRQQYGIKIKSVMMGNPSTILTHKSIMQCTIPQIITVEAFSNFMELETTLVGLSTNGIKWYFVDAILFETDAKTKLPELSPKLIIPAAKVPVILGADGKEIKMKQ